MKKRKSFRLLALLLVVVMIPTTALTTFAESAIANDEQIILIEGDNSIKPYATVRYGNYLYAACGAAGVQIYDISDIENPMKVTPEDNTYLQGKTVNKGSALCVDNGFLYVACDGSLDSDRIIRKFSLTNPAAPELVATFSSKVTNDMEISGDLLFTATTTNRGRVYDMSEVANPTTSPNRKGLFIADGVTSVAVYGTVLYATLGSKLYAINASTPTSMTVDNTVENGDLSLGVLDVTNGELTDLQVANGYLYCNDKGNKKIYKIDISDPANIENAKKRTEVYEGEVAANSFIVDNDFLYIETGKKVEISNLSTDKCQQKALIDLTDYMTNSSSYSLYKDGNYIYITDSANIYIAPVVLFTLAKSEVESVAALPVVLKGSAHGNGTVKISVDNDELTYPYTTDVSVASDGNWSHTISDIYDDEYEVRAGLYTSEGITVVETTVMLTINTGSATSIERTNTTQNNQNATEIQATVLVNNSEKSVTCTGVIPMGTRIGFKEVKILVKNPEDVTVFEQKQKSLGNFDFSFTLPQPLYEDQNYNVTISCEGPYAKSYTFKYYGESYIQGALNNLKNSSLNESADNYIINVLNTYNFVLGLDIEEGSDYYSLNNKRPVLEAISGEEFEDTNELIQAFSDAVSNQKAKEDALYALQSKTDVTELKAAVLANDTLFDLDLTSDNALYKDLSQEAQNDLFEELSDILTEDGAITFDDLKATFSDNKMLLKLFNTTHWSELTTYISKYQIELGLTATQIRNYLELNDDEKIIVNKVLYRLENDGHFTQISEIKDLLVKKTNSIISASNNDYNGGGGDGGSSSIVVKYPSKAEEEAETIVQPQKEAFDDLQPVPWAKESILALNSMGVLYGKGNGKFAPSDEVTREEFVAMILRALNVPLKETECNFEDLEKGAWYYPYIATATDISLINGISKNVFGIGETLTREQMAVMLHRMLVYKNLKLTSDRNVNFSDEISEYAQESVQAMVNSGILNGVGDNRFAAMEKTNRAMAAKAVYGTLQAMKEMELND